MNSTVARYNYPLQFGKDVDALALDIKEMLLTGRYILSQEVEQFEREFAAYVGGRFARGVNSGTDALILSLLALGVGPGDEVITHANSFHATAAAILLAGATPVLVDAREDSFLMDVDQVTAAVSRRTKVLLPVHLFGKPTDLTILQDIADRSGALVVEDAAQAHGASIHGRRAGSLGAAGCFSFHPSKNLAAAGDGGAIVTSDARVMERINQLRSLGQREPNDHVIVGFNSKLDAIQARVLSWKLPRLEAWNAARASIAARYRELLDDLPVSFQRVDAGEVHVYHLFQLRTSHRDPLLKYLRDDGIDAVVRYPTPVHLQNAFAGMGWKRGQFPVSERLAEELLCLPIRPDMQEPEIARVCERVRQFFNQFAANT